MDDCFVLHNIVRLISKLKSEGMDLTVFGWGDDEDEDADTLLVTKPIYKYLPSPFRLLGPKHLL